jgi:hypothetical protein
LSPASEGQAEGPISRNPKGESRLAVAIGERLGLPEIEQPGVARTAARALVAAAAT